MNRELADSPHRPALRDDLQIAGVAILMRVVVLATATWLCGVSLDQYVKRGDGESYVMVAESMLGRRAYVELDEYHHRVFLGYPALMALVAATGVPVGIAGLLITFVSAGGVAVLAGRVFVDRRVGWASAMLVPHWVVNSSLVMTEAPALIFSLAGVFLAKREHWLSAGVACAGAGLVRPMTCFATLAVLVALAMAKHLKAAVVTGTACAAVFAAGLIYSECWRGGWFESARIYHASPRAYGGELFTWPGASLLRETFSSTASPVFSIYIWLHVAFVAGALGLLVYQQRRAPDARGLTALPWVVGNTLFVLCIGSFWGYQHFPRFHILSQPPMFYAWRRTLPERAWVWLTLSVPITIYAIFGVRATP